MSRRKEWQHLHGWLLAFQGCSRSRNSEGIGEGRECEALIARLSRSTSRVKVRHLFIFPGDRMFGILPLRHGMEHGYLDGSSSSAFFVLF